jgi:hypothetical protein
MVTQDNRVQKSNRNMMIEKRTCDLQACQTEMFLLQHTSDTPYWQGDLQMILIVIGSLSLVWWH